MEISKDQEMTPCEVGMTEFEFQKILDKENLYLENFLEYGMTVGVDSLQGEDYDRVKQLLLWRSQPKGARVKRNHESQEHSGVITMENVQHNHQRS